jgi:hypothetical protein
MRKVNISENSKQLQPQFRQRATAEEVPNQGQPSQPGDRRPDIAIAYERLCNSVESVRSAAFKLEERFAPVLSPSRLVRGEPGDGKAAPMAPMAESMEALNAKLTEALVVLEEIAVRCEL